MWDSSSGTGRHRLLAGLTKIATSSDQIGIVTAFCNYSLGITIYNSIILEIGPALGWSGKWEEGKRPRGMSPSLKIALPSVSRENTKPTICYFQRFCDTNLSLHNKEGISQCSTPFQNLPIWRWICYEQGRGSYFWEVTQLRYSYREGVELWNFSYYYKDLVHKVSKFHYSSQNGEELGN